MRFCLPTLVWVILTFYSEGLKAQAPTQAAKSIVYNTVFCQQLTMSWTNGNGSQRLVIGRRASAINSFPVDNAYYSANDTFGLGSKIGADVFVVYRGGGSSATVKNLEPNTTYYFAIIEYNSGGSNYYYLTSPYPEASVTTENITADFSIADDYQCIDNNNFSFTNASSNSLTFPMTYNWNFGDNITSSAKDPSHIYAKGGVFNVKLEVFTTGCYASLTKQDTVVLPTITDFVLDPIPGNDSIQCLHGNFFKIKNITTVPPVGGTSFDESTYNWSYGDNTFSSGYNAQKKYANDGVFEVKLVTKRRISPDSRREYCFDSISKVYVVLPPPLKTSKITLSDTALCLTGNIFNFSHNAPNISASWWKFGNNDSLQGNPVDYSYPDPGKYYISLDVVDTKGCKDFRMDSLRVYAQPNNYFTGLLPQYCQGEPIVTLKPNLSGGVFAGPGVNSADSTFNPVNLGTYEIYYIYRQGDCIDSSRQTVTVYPRPVFSLGNDTILCNGDAIPLNIEYGSAAYIWSTGQNTQSINVSNGGQIWGEAYDGKCRYRDSIYVRQIRAPQFELGNDTNLCGGNVVNLSVISDLATYVWSDGSTESQRQIAQSGYYKVTVTNACATFSDSIDIEIQPYACTIFIPNVFSPNGDGQNERFRPLGDFDLINIRVYDRWGRKMYDSPSPEGWDGKEDGEVVPIGTYFATIEYMIVEGNSYVYKLAAVSLHVVY